jgi:gamma-glutamylcyclotransferase (GGCT)/AIG2-like uncharacterized protein YtfP
MSLLFVYGTLLPGEPNQERLRGGALQGAARTEAGYALLDFGEHPGMVRGGAGQVRGALFEVTVETLRDLDRFEEASAFRRERVRLEDGRRVEAYLYLGLAPPGGEIPGGDWAAHRRRSAPAGPDNGDKS